MDPSLSRDSFPPDGQGQSEAAKTQKGRSNNPKVINLSVQEPSLDGNEDHQEVPHKDLAPSKKNPAKKKSAPQQVPKSKKAPHQPKGPSKKDKAEAGSSRAKESSPVVSERFSMSPNATSSRGNNRSRSPVRRTTTKRRPSSREFREDHVRRSREYSRSRYDHDHYDRDSRDRYREDSRSRHDYFSRDRYSREGDRHRRDDRYREDSYREDSYRDDRHREDRHREDRYRRERYREDRFRDVSRSRYDHYHTNRDPRDRFRETSRPRYDSHRYDYQQESEPRHSIPRQDAHQPGEFREEQENMFSEENLRRLQGLIDASVARGRPDPPPAPGPAAGPMSFQDTVASHSSAPKDVLSRLSKMYGDKIKQVRDTITNEMSYVYDFDVPRDNTFWATPEATLPSDEYGTFKLLVAPTINKNWAYSSEPQLEEVVEGVVYPPGVKPEKGMDALAKSAVPGRCSDKDIDIFLSSRPLTKYVSNHAETGTGRHLEVDPEVFPGQRFVGCDSENLIPSFEHKSRLLARDGYAALDMVRAQEDKTKLLFSNWNSPGIWHPEKGVLTNDDGSLVMPENGAVLADSVSKEDLLQLLYNKSDLSKLVIRNLEHLTKLAVASHAESKIFMREIVLYNALPVNSNMQLVESVRNSQLSSPLLFGPIPNSFREKIRTYHVNGTFKPFAPPSEIKFQAPVRKHSFRNRSRARRRPPVRQPYFLQAAHAFKSGRGGKFARQAKNQTRGRKVYSSLPPQPRNQQVSRVRNRGKGRGKGKGGETSKRGRGKGHR